MCVRVQDKKYKSQQCIKVGEQYNHGWWVSAPINCPICNNLECVYSAGVCWWVLLAGGCAGPAGRLWAGGLVVVLVTAWSRSAGWMGLFVCRRGFGAVGTGWRRLRTWIGMRLWIILGGGLGGLDGRSSRPGRIYCCFSASVSYGCSPHNPRMYPSTGCYPWSPYSLN